MPLFKSLIAWGIVLCLAVANGALREVVLIPLLGRSSGLILSGVVLCFCVAVVAYGHAQFNQDITVTQSLVVGVIWLCLTLAFEFGFGHYVQQKSWSELLTAYTFKDGNLWPVVLLVIFLAPYLATLAHARKRHAGNGA